MLIRYVTLWPWPLTSWPWTFTALRVSCGQTLYKIGAKLNNPRLSYSRFSTFASCNFREWALLPNGSQECVETANFTKLSEDIGWSSLHCRFVSEFGYLAAFSNTGGSKLSDVENDAKFRTFDPLWKLGEGWARSVYQYCWRFTYD